MTNEVISDVNAEISAAALDSMIINCEFSGSTARLSQMAALVTISDGEVYKQITNPHTNLPFRSFTEYCETRVSSLSGATISQGLTVSRKLAGFPVERLASCGIERLYIALRLMDKGVDGFATLEEVVSGAETQSQLTLRNLNAGTRVNKDEVEKVQLFTETVTRISQNRMTAIYNKFKAVLTNVAGSGESVTSSKVLDFFFTTTAGLPDDFLAQVADGKGGSAPTEDGHYIHVTTLEEITLYLADQYYKQGTPLEQLIEHMQNAILGLQEKQRDELREADLLKSGRDKAEKEAGKTRMRLAAKLIKCKPRETIVTADGSEYEVGDTFIGDGYPEGGSVFIKLTKDGTDAKAHKVTVKGKVVAAVDISDWGVVEIKSAPKEDKPVKMGITKEDQLKGKKTPKVKVLKTEADELAEKWLEQ